MSKEIYGQESVTVSEIIGRECNNPLGPSVLTALVEACGLSAGSHVLDFGSGRGQMALALARLCGCSVTGIEVSEAMWRKAREVADGFEGRVTFLHGDAMSHPWGEGRFDAVMSFDVFAYIQDRSAMLAVLHRALGAGGVLMFTDYHVKGAISTETRRLVESWRIQIPESTSRNEQSLRDAGFEVVSLRDTTAEYRAHWAEMNRRTVAKKQEIVERCGESAFLDYLSATESILAGVDAGGFGHFCCLARKLR